MSKEEKKDDFNDFINEYNLELDEALKTPETTRKYFDELDEFIANISEDELSYNIDSMLYNTVNKILSWSEEQIESVLSNVSVSIINEYLKCIKNNEELQEGNNAKICLIKNLIKKQKIDKNKIPHDINQVNLCGWVSKDSTNFKKNEIHFGCKFTITLHWYGRYDIDGKPYVSFIDIEYRGKNAVSISPYLVKGKRVAISGKLAQNRWEQDGIKNSHIFVLANDVVIFNDERKFEIILE